MLSLGEHAVEHASENNTEFLALSLKKVHVRRFCDVSRGEKKPCYGNETGK